MKPRLQSYRIFRGALCLSQNRSLPFSDVVIEVTKSFLCAVFLTVLSFVHGNAIAAGTETDNKIWSVLLITVDSMRPDHMSLYGYGRETTPQLAKFAEESMVFENAFATSGWTSPGVISLLTGYYPPVHGQNGRYSFYDKALTSPLRVLATEGYDILGHIKSGPTVEGLGIQRAIKPNLLLARPKLENFIELRSAHDAPFFAWLHLRETHLPYNPSDASAARWTNMTHTSPGIEAVQNHRMILRPQDVDVEYRHAGRVQFSDQDVPIIRSLYDGEMADVDERLGRALVRMRQTGLLDRTVVIITADHGEELFEHGWIGHASTSYDGKLYDEIIRIPLIIRLPDQSVVGRFDALVQGVDIMPTIFDVLGIPRDRIDPAMQGRSLLPAAKGEEAFSRRYVFSQTTLKGWTTPSEEMRSRVISVRTKTHKLIWIPKENGYRIEGYHLGEDPQEANDIYASRKAEFSDLEQALHDWSEENRRVAAALVSSGAERRVSTLMEALRSADLLEAVRNWESIAMLERTWGMEVDPFFDHEPYRSHWRKIRSAASLLIAKALACHADGGDFRQIDPSRSPDAENWQCHR